MYALVSWELDGGNVSFMHDIVRRGQGNEYSGDKKVTLKNSFDYLKG